MSAPKKATNPYISLLKTAWKYAKGDRSQYAKIYGMFAVSKTLHALEPFIWGLFINAIQLEGANILHSSWIYVAIYFFLHLVSWAFHGPARVMENELAFKIGRNYLKEMYHKALHLPVKWHQEQHSGSTISRINKAHGALKDFFEDGSMFLEPILKFTFAFAAMIYFTPLFGIIAFIMGISIIRIIQLFDKPIIKHIHGINEKEHVVSSTLFDSLSNIISVITLRLEERVEKGLLQRVNDIFPVLSKYVRLNEIKWFVVDTLVASIYVIILIGYIYQTYAPGEVFLIGSLVTLMGYVHRFSSVFHDIAWQYSTVVEYDTHIKTAANITNAYDVLEEESTFNPLPAKWEQMVIKHLNFHHNSKTAEEVIQGLQDISIRINRGQKIAFIGESGSGKSTLLALLRGLYPPLPGMELLVDGTPYDRKAINNKVTLFPQEPEIFENTIEYNITLGLTFEKEEINRICQAVHFQEVVEQLPKGLASNIQEKGVNLSGGQKQRLALARGVFASQTSDLVLMDEPTSSVDPKTEIVIYNELFKLFKDKAVISSLHRLHLLPKFDYIYILKEGKVAAEGTFSTLKANSSLFQELWRHQEEHKIVTSH